MIVYSLKTESWQARLNHGYVYSSTSSDFGYLIYFPKHCQNFANFFDKFPDVSPTSPVG